MASDLLFSLRDVEIKFGKKVIFQDLNLNLHKGDMIALVGKNGVFGSPSFIYDSEVFWGDDRLEDCIKWIKLEGK